MSKYTPYDTEDDGWQDYVDLGKVIQTCHECAYMVEYMDKGKWPDKCPVCGRKTSELDQNI